MDNTIRSVGALIGALAAIASCAEPEWTEVKSSSYPIINGNPATSDPAILELLVVAQGSRPVRCTSTLIAPRILLTAAHCIADNPRGSLYLVFPGHDDHMITTTALLPTSAVAYDPEYGDLRDGHDIALVRLAGDLAQTPIPVNRAPLGSDDIGQLVRYVGYGLSNAVSKTGSGIKRESTQPLGQVARHLIVIDANPQGPCTGDSGGPLLMDRGEGEVIIGVASFVEDRQCTSNTTYQRLDTQLGWLDDQIASWSAGDLPITSDAGIEGPALQTAHAATGTKDYPRHTDAAIADPEPGPVADPEPGPATTTRGEAGCRCITGDATGVGSWFTTLLLAWFWGGHRFGRQRACRGSL